MPTAIIDGPAFLRIDGRRRTRLSQDAVRDLAIKTPSIDTPVGA